MNMPAPETGFVVALKHILTYVATPVLLMLGWLFRKLYNRVDELEHKVTDLDKHQAVQEAQMRDIKQDIRNIDKKLDKIIDSLHGK